MIFYFNWELYFIFHLHVQSLLQLGPNKQVFSDRPKNMVVLSIYIIRRNFNRREKHIHVPQHVSDSENEDEVMMFEITSK